MMNKFGWIAKVILSAAFLCGGSVPLQADLLFFTNQGAFQAQTTGLVTQTFDDVAAFKGVGPGGAVGVSNPLDITTNDGMLPGLSITADTDLTADIAIFGSNRSFLPEHPGILLTNSTVFGNYPDSTLTFAFSPGVTAASLSVLSLFSSQDVNVSIFDASANSLGSYLISSAPGTGVGKFFGVISTGAEIGSLSIKAQVTPGVLKIERSEQSVYIPFLFPLKANLRCD